MNDEEVLCGQVLIDNTVFYKLSLKEDDFQDPKCRSLFNTFKYLSDRGLEMSTLTISRNNETLSAGWYSALADKIPSAANYDYFQTRIKEVSNKRKLHNIAMQINDSLNQGNSADKVREEVETQLTDLSTSSEGWEIKHITSVLISTVDRVEERFKLQGKLPGITTGFDRLNDLTLGFRPRMLYLFGARPSRGKTALMLNMAVAAGKHSKIGLINTESANEEMGVRIMSSYTGVDSQDLASGHINKTMFAKLSHAAGELSKRDIFFYDEPNANLPTVIAKCREFVRRDKVEIIFIDYIQNIDYNDKQTERENIGYVSSRLKQLARSLNIPIVAMAQLRRDPGGLYNRPSMNELLGSGRLEQDADFIGLIWWQLLNPDEVKDGGAPDFKEWVLADKNRDGQTGAVRVKFDKRTVRFMEVTNE